MVAGSVLAGLAVVAYFRGAIREIRPLHAIVYHVVNYGDGLIRRGLPGEMLSWFVQQKDMIAVRAAANAAYIALQAILAAMLFAWVVCIDLRRRDYLLFGLHSASSSPRSSCRPWPSTTPTSTSTRIFLLIIAAVGFARNWPVAIIAAGVVGPFIHESFVFCWLTLGIVVLWDGPISLARLLLPMRAAGPMACHLSRELSRAYHLPVDGVRLVGEHLSRSGLAIWPDGGTGF